SPRVPQNVTPSEVQVSGTQSGATQTPPVQTSVPGQAPQSMLRPQPSPSAPQYWVSSVWQVVVGIQLGPPTQSLSSHTQSPLHSPHSKNPEQPLPMLPQ